MERPRIDGLAILRRIRWPAVAVAAASALVIAVVASTLPWPTREPGRPDVAVVSPSPAGAAASPGPGASEGASATDGPPNPAYAPLAALTPGDTTGAVLALDSDFRLESLDGTPPADLAARLTVEPSLEFAVAPEADGTSVRLRPTEPLAPGAVYRFTLAGTDGRTLDTWAFQARQSVRIVGTVPGDTETDVPLDTGIEITFDQDGVVDPESHVTIAPATKGRFERHGRVLVFVPDRLKPATIYTVTVSRGVRVAGTDETLAEDMRFRFETAAKAGSKRATVFQFADDVVEVATAARPELTIWAYSEDESAPPRTARIEVYRLANLERAIDAFRQLRRSAGWARWSTDSLVPTSGLRRVMAFDGRLEQASGSLWFRFPKALPAGAYLVQHPSTTRPIQMVMQVTDVAGYLTVSDSRTLVWANDVASRGPLPGATVTLDDAAMGRTDKDGLLLADTPAALRPTPDRACADACDAVVIVKSADGRSAFLPATGDRNGGSRGYDFSDGSDRDERYWLVYHTDRTVYRRTDVVNVWGVIRDRDTGDVPATVEVHLVADSGGPASPSIATLHARPGSTGAFTGSLRLTDLPEGSYQLALRVGSKVVGATGIQVDRILKPAYRIEVETGRRVYIEGDRIRITARANFFEGTPVPGVPLRIGGYVERALTTARDGTATYRTVARVDRDNEEYGGPSHQSVSIGPARAEEGEIAGSSREFIVFPSTRTIDGQATIRAGRVRLQGGVHLVDRDRIEAELAAGRSPWEVDVRGAPVRGTTVTARFVELIPVRRRVGTEYDFIEKKVVPVYEYHNRTRAAGTVKVRTAADGTFSVSVRDSGKDHDYRIALAVGDPEGHTARLVTYASGGSVRDSYEWASLTSTDPTADDAAGYRVGDRIDLTMRESRAARSGSRYLFHLAQRGLREAIVQSSPRLVRRFATWAIPNVSITAVRFTGRAYVEGGEYHASFAAADRRVQVALSTTRPRYAPGADVTLDVRTRDAAGKPVAATVILQAVDEKLFHIGGAADADPLRELYASVAGGIRTQYASHRARRQGFEGGDTAGGDGDERADFRDALLFEAIETGPDGRASTTFKLSDDLTSWRVSAAAITADLGAGGGSIQVPVGLPFFVDATIAPEYLVGDRPSIQVRAYGSALPPGADVRLSVESAGLGMEAVVINATAFESVTVAMPRLTVGAHELTITAQTGSGASVRRDRLTRSFVVIDSRLERTRSTYTDLAALGSLQGGDGLTTVVVSDASAGRYLPLLLDVAAGDGARLERALAAAMATSLLAERYGGPDGSGPAGDLDSDRYQTPDGGIAPVPYASSDLELTTLVAIVAPERFDVGRLRRYLDGVLAEPKQTRERRMYALAGLAAVGAPVLPAIRAAAVDDRLTIRERLMVGLGAAALGDAATARSMAAALFESYGERLGEGARLRVGDSESDIAAATALMAMLAAGTGDPLAPALWAYVEDNPSREAPFELHAVGFIARLLDRLPVQPASFAYLIDGERTAVELGVGETFQLTLTANQRANLRLERIGGEIGVTTSWREPVAASTFKADPDIKIRRSRTPKGTVRTGDLVRVDLTVTFGSKAPAGCHQVTDLVPSGLIAVGNLESWSGVGDEAPATASVTMPYAHTGQRVMFCAERTTKTRTSRLRYYARVITPGTYVWEPAIVESRTGADRAALTSPGEVTIR